MKQRVTGMKPKSKHSFATFVTFNESNHQYRLNSNQMVTATCYFIYWSQFYDERVQRNKNIDCGQTRGLIVVNRAAISMVMVLICSNTSKLILAN